MSSRTTQQHIYRASTQEDVEAAVAVIAPAFATLLASEWLEPDPDHRTSTLAAVFRIAVSHAVDVGEVHLLRQPADEGSPGVVVGAAVWFDQTRHVPPPHDYARRLQTAAGTNAPAFQILDRLFEQHHPDGPHHYLALLAVKPSHQRAGIGSALLRHHHTHLDEQRLPAYLEAASTGNRRLYQRHGYRPCGSGFELPKAPSSHPCGIQHGRSH